MFSNSLDKLKKQSDKALNAFNTIVTDLTNSNKQLATEKETRVKSIEQLTSEVSITEELEVKNNKIINKINKFLSDED